MYQANRGAEVQRIVIYRNGCGEGQFSQILKYEVPFIKLGIERLGCKAKLTIMVPNRMHHIRFFPAEIDSNDAPPDQNIQPGVVIDTNVVHPTFCEFYLNSHRALQGTARTSRYTVLLNDIKMSMDDLQGITYQLCYGHQIVFSPTCLPSPVYIANCYAERGRMIFNEWWKAQPSGHAMSSSYEEIENQLGYFNDKVFQKTRINA